MGRWKLHGSALCPGSENTVRGNRASRQAQPTLHLLAPTLAPGDVVVMDNLSAHKGAGVGQAIQARGATLLYLPPYSPDFNPIEQAFAKLKALLPK